MGALLQRGNGSGGPNADSLHPVWQRFLDYCREIGHGEIGLLKIQDGLPVMAELTRKKIKFNP
jgi:hypothetical protein